MREALIELPASLPGQLNLPKEAFEQFVLNLSLCREPVAFELLGAEQRITAQFVVHPQDAALVRRQAQAHFPDAGWQARESTLGYIHEEPLKAVIIAAAAGATLMLVASLLARRDPR